MATLTGVGGSVTITEPGLAGLSLHFFEWRATIHRDVFDDSNFDDAKNARTKIGGMYDLKGTARATADQADHPSIGSMATEHATPTAAFVLQLISGKTLTFAGICSDIAIATVKGDRVFYDLTFESSDDVTESS